MDSISFLPSFLRMLFALALVIGLMIGAMHLFRRLFASLGTDSDNGPIINVIASRCIGPKSSILLVEIIDRIVVIGVCSNNMSHLTTICEAETIDILKNRQIQQRKLSALSEYNGVSKLVTRAWDSMIKRGKVT